MKPWQFSSSNTRGVSKVRWMVGTVIMLPIFTIWILFLTGYWQSFKVISASMHPTLEVGDCLVMKKKKVLHDLKNQIVVIDDPIGEPEPLAKRVIATENSIVQIKQGEIFVDGSKDPSPGETLNRRIGMIRTWSLEDDEIFVLGDNRNNSMDSIEFGPVKTEHIRGVIAFRYWPLDRFGRVE